MTARLSLSSLPRLLPATLIGLLLLPVATPDVEAQLFKWIDEEGQVRYSDHLPPTQRKKRHQRLSDDGHILETTEAATPPEELKRQRAEKLRQEEEARLQAEKDARLQAEKEFHDNVLLMTFSTENEIVEVAKERVAVIDSVIRLLRTNIKVEQQKLKELEAQARRGYTDKGQVVPGGLAQNIDYFGEKIRDIENRLELKIAERARVEKQYADDLVRYRELTRDRKDD